LREQLDRLHQRLAKWERAGKRQATPFARRKHTSDRKKPGRKAGQGRFSYRAKPTADQVDETKESRVDGCPECGGRLTDVKDHEQFVVDIPEVEPQMTRYVMQRGYCGQCRRRVRSRHREQISTAT
jgi:transposase